MKEPQDPFLRACFQLPVEHTPIWIMRQAGRYLPEYRELRTKAGTFLDLCRQPHLAMQATLQPLQRFNLDAAILFSDILVVPEAMGQTLTFTTGDGPQLTPPIRTPADVDQLLKPNPEEKLDYVMGAVVAIREALQGRIPLIGFSGSPWTLATYMVEGGASKDFAAIKTLLYTQPELVDRLLALLADVVANYLNAQIRHGIQAVQLFDTWGGILAPREFERFSLEPMRRVIRQLTRIGTDGQRIPIILFAKGCGQWLQKMATTGCEVLGLDWTVDLGSARELLNGATALQGNLDPAILLGSAERVREEAVALLRSYGPHPGHIFNLGHGIGQQVNPDRVALLVETVHAESRAILRGAHS